jgi:anti-sigma-K factor RskA
MMTHQEASELLAVFALDAVDEAEQVLLEEHLATCPRCRAELDAHREVAAALGNSVEPLPEGLWSSIASRLPPRPDEEPPPMPVLIGEGAETRDAPSATFLAPRVPRAPRATRPRRSSGGRGRLISLASIAVAAAAVAAVLGVNLVHDDHQISNLRQTSADSAVQAALHAPGRKVVTAEGAGHAELAKFVILPSGQGYLVQADLPALPSKETYQLWGVVNGQPISLGLLGRSPHSGAFTLAGSPAPTKLGITVEPAGGSVVPTSAMVANVTV